MKINYITCEKCLHTLSEFHYIKDSTTCDICEKVAK